MPRKPARAYGSGSVTWLSPTRVKIRVRVSGKARSKTIRVTHRDHGGRGEADAALEAFVNEVGTEAPVPEESALTLGTLMDAYVADRARVGKARSTVESYENTRRRLSNTLANTPVDQLNPQDLDRFYGELARGGMGANTIRQTHAILRAAVGWAVQKGVAATNQVSRATPPDRKRVNKQRIEIAETHAMIQAALNKEDAVLAVAIFLLMYAGLRRGEACGLRWSDFDPTLGVLRCQRQWVAGKGGQHLEDLKSDTGSQDGVRVIDFAPGTVALLERYRKQQADLLDIEPGGWLLSYDGGSTPLRAKALTERITSLGKSLGIDASPHSFRRTADTQLHAAGVDLDTASRRQGHTPEVMMRHYVQGTADSGAVGALKFEQRLIDQGLPIGQLLS